MPRRPWEKKKLLSEPSKNPFRGAKKTRDCTGNRTYDRFIRQPIAPSLFFFVEIETAFDT